MSTKERKEIFKQDAQISTEEFEEDVEIFYNGIVAITKKLGQTSSDGARWVFDMSFRGKRREITIDNVALMAGPTAFNNLFKSWFGIQLPYLLRRKPNKGDVNYWDKFQQAIEEMCTEEDPEDSTEWIETGRLVENIARFNITDDKRVWYDTTSSDRCLLRSTDKDGVTYYCVKPDCVATAMKDIGVKIPIGKIGETLNLRNMKRKTNPAIRIGQKVTRAWWITAECIDAVAPDENGDGSDSGNL